MTRIRTATHNVWQGQRGDRLMKNLTAMLRATKQPHAVALQEAVHLCTPVEGYHRLHATGPEFLDPLNQSSQLLIRREGVTLHSWIARQVDGPHWVGPKQGKRQPPRVFIRATISLDDDPSGERFDIFAGHRTPGGPNPHIQENARSWAAEDRFIEKWSRRRSLRHGLPQIWLADHNGRRGDTGPLSLTELAWRMGSAQLAIKGIDGAIVVRGRARARKLLRKFGSDGHRPVVVVVETD